MRWQRPARIVIALVGIGCAVAIPIYTRKRVAAPPPPAALIDPKVTSQQDGVLNLRTNVNTGKEDLKIEAERQTSYEDGRMRLRRAHFTSKRNDGKVFEIWADLAESQGKAVTGDEPGLIHLTGHVRTKSSDALEVITDEATYDNVQGLATIPGKLTFTRDRLTGSGVGATYDRQRDVLWLHDEASVKRAPDEKGEGGLAADAKGIGIARAERYMNMMEHAHIVQPSQSLAADNLIIHFTEDEKGAKLIEMHGAARVTPGRSAQKNAPNLQADEMNLEFQADGQTLRHATLAGGARLMQDGDQGKQTITAANIDLVTGADGRTLTNLQAQTSVEVQLPASGENPDRTIRAASLVTSGDEKNGLSAAVFDGDVTFTEKSPGAPAPRIGGRGRAAPAPVAATPAVDRSATSRSLALDLNGQLGAIKTAEFRQNVKFRDGNMQAGADIAVHDQVQGLLVLTPLKGAKSSPWVDDGSVRVDAGWIQVEMATHNLRAKENVVTRMTQGKTSAGDTHTPALFDASQPVFATGANLKYVNATKSATVTALSVAYPARVYQRDGKNTISATDRIDLEQDSGNLHAIGAVRTIFDLDDPSGTPAPKPKPVAQKAATPAAKGKDASKDVPEPPRPTNTSVLAKEMSYVDAARRATYTGDAAGLVHLSGPDSDIDAQRVVLTLATDERALKTLEATGTMYAKFQGGRETIGDSLVYDPKSQSHVIRGLPMFFKNVQLESGKKSCSLEKSTELHYEGKDETIDEPANLQRTLRTSTQTPCDEPLKATAARLKAIR